MSKPPLVLLPIVVVLAIRAPLAAAQTDAETAADADVALTDEERALLDAALAEGETIEIDARAPVDPSAPGAADVSREELLVVPGARGDAIGAARNLPGIANVDAYDGSGVLAIRGTSGEDSAVLLDGMPIPLAMHFGSLQSIMPTEMIDRIELSPGGFGVEHGRATGGVLNIVSRRRTPTAWSGFTEVSFINAAGFVEGPLSARHGLTMSAAFRRSLIDVILPVFIPDDVDLSFRTPPRYYDAQLRLDWAASATSHVSLLVVGSDDRIELDVGEVDPLDPVVTGNVRGRESFWRALARWQFTSENVENTLAVSHGNDIREQYLNGEAFFYRLEPAETVVRDDASWRINGAFRARAGAEVQIVRGDIAAHITLPSGEGAADPILAEDRLIEYDQRTNDTRGAAWAALDIRPQSRLTVTPQVRIDHFDRNSATVIQPRLSASLRVTKPVELRVAGGTYSRPLALAEQLRDDLDPERALHATGGVAVDLAPGVRVSATGFVTRLNDLIVRDNSVMSEDALAVYKNDGTGRVVGGELLVRAQRDRFFGWLAYTASRSTRVDGPGQQRRLFDYDQTHNLIATGSTRWGKWRFGARFRLASGLPHTPVLGSVYSSDNNVYRPMFGAPNSERTDLNHQLDLRVDRRFRLGSATIDGFLDIANVYANGQHIDYEYNFDYSERSAITDVPLLPSFGIRGTFE